MVDEAFWRRKYGLPRFFHATNEEVETVAPLPSLPNWDDEVKEFVNEHNIAWQVYANTLLLSGGDREEADRAFQASLKWQKEKRK